jgi:FixJ family two-component response regulator
MDVRMPNMSGLEAYEVLRSRGVRLPVLFLTAHQDVPDGYPRHEGGRGRRAYSSHATVRR